MWPGFLNMVGLPCHNCSSTAAALEKRLSAIYKWINQIEQEAQLFGTAVPVVSQWNCSLIVDKFLEKVDPCTVHLQRILSFHKYILSIISDFVL